MIMKMCVNDCEKVWVKDPENPQLMNSTEVKERFPDLGRWKAAQKKAW